MKPTCVLIFAILAAAACGCDRPTPTPRATTAPAQVAQGGVPAANPATQPTATFMKINGRLVMFPAAKLKLEDDGSRVIAMLFSDDPPEAIKDDYDGNSFYLQMVLDIADVKDLPTAVWVHKSKTSEYQDSPYAIYLNGRKVQIQPYDARATFTVTEPTTVHLSGQMLLWNSADSTGLPQMVVVAGDIPVTVKVDQGAGKTATAAK